MHPRAPKEKDILMLYKKGVYWKDIIKKTGVSPITISRILKRNNIGFNYKSQMPSRKYSYVKKYAKKNNKLVRIYNGTVLKTIHCPVCNKEIKVVPHNPNQKCCSVKCGNIYKKHFYNKKIIKNVKKLYLQNKTLHNICKTIGISMYDLYKIIHKNRIKLNRPDGRVYTINENYFKKIDTEDKAYWLGFIGGDGNINQRRRTVITLKYSDRNHLQKFLDCLKSNYRIRNFKKKNGKKYSTISISSKKIYNDLLKYNITERKSLTLKPYYKIKEKMKRHYLRGFIDSDGCLSIHKNKWRINLVGSFHVVNFFEEFVKKHINTKATTRKHKNIFSFSLSGNHASKKLSKILYQDAKIFLDRKMNTYKKISATKLKPKPINPTRDEMVKFKNKFGSWEGVGKYLGLRPKSIWNVVAKYYLQRKHATT